MIEYKGGNKNKSYKSCVWYMIMFVGWIDLFLLCLCWIGCEFFNYGNNCSKVCECGFGGDRCDVVSGCVCLLGWMGENCDEDVDECIIDLFICGFNCVCKNLEGFYLCGCEDGF